MKKITIDPVTRLEGHGRIDLFLNDEGDVANAYMVIPELRGFEKFSQGRRVEELTDITPRICGVPGSAPLGLDKGLRCGFPRRSSADSQKTSRALLLCFLRCGSYDPFLYSGRA